VFNQAAMRRELRDQYKKQTVGAMPWSTKAFVRTVREIEHHDVVNSGIFADEFTDKHPRQWTRSAFKVLEDATETYMIEVTLSVQF
jgi:hypothetical protein